LPPCTSRPPDRLGLPSRSAARTPRAYVQAAVGERAAVPDLIVCVQAFGSVAHLHPHLHVLMTDGAFRRNGTFVPLPESDTRGSAPTSHHASRNAGGCAGGALQRPCPNGHHMPVFAQSSIGRLSFAPVRMASSRFALCNSVSTSSPVPQRVNRCQL
jgi:hypothetical protein